MPDRAIIDLTEATELTDADLAVIYQDGETKQITAETMKEYMGGGICDISALPAASTIASNDLAVISQGGTAKKVTAQQLKTFIEGDTPGETVTLTLDETGTQYTIPFTVIDPTGTEASDWTAYLLTSTPLTEAEIQTMRLYEDGTEQVVSDTLTFSEWQNGDGNANALYYVANGTKSLIVQGGQGTANNRRVTTVVFVIPEAGANYPAGTYVNKLMNGWHTYTYTVGGSSSGGDLPDVDTTDNGAVLQVVNGAWATGLKLWVGTQAQYDAIVTKDNGTLYIILEATT